MNLNHARINSQRHRKKRNRTCSSDRLMHEQPLQIPSLPTQQTQLRSDLNHENNSNKPKKYRFPPGLSPKPRPRPSPKPKPVYVAPPGLIRNNRNNRNNTNNLLQNDYNVIPSKSVLSNNLFKAIQCFQPKFATNIIELFLNELTNRELQMLLDNKPLLKHKINESMKRISFNGSNQRKQSKIKQLLTNKIDPSRPTKPPIPNKTKCNLPPGLEPYIVEKNKKQQQQQQEQQQQQLFNKIQDIEAIFAKQITMILLQQINYNKNELLLLLSDEIELTYKINEIILTNTFLENIDKIQRNRLIGQRLFDKIQLIEPYLATKITGMLLQLHNNELFILLASKRALIKKINEALVILKQYEQKDIEQKDNNNRYTNNRYTNNSNIIKKREESKSITDCTEIDAQIIDNDDEYSGLPQICSIQVFRVIVNAIIPKQIFELLLETKCIEKPNSAQKIFVRSHKSHYHDDSTVLYIHFINFDEEEYEFCRDRYFDFRDQQNGKRITWFNRRNRYYQNENYYKNNYKHKHKKTIFDIMGNELGLIKVYKAKEYESFKANINYLSRIVNICLRCKINKAAPRKRVCTFCVNDERNDRIKIAEYFNNPENNVNHKMDHEIQKDLIEKLKIELNLIPLAYKSECNNIDIETRKCTSKGAAKCSFIHNSNERIFGEKLNQIRSNAIKRQYNAQGEFELNDYYAVKLQLKYRKIIGEYYNNYWKNKCFDQLSIDIIKKYLINKQIKLYLIPTIYKNWCYYFKDIDRLCSKKTNICTFIHDEKQQIFGDMLWRIKYNALQEREKNNIHSQYNMDNNNNHNIEQQYDVSLIDDDNNNNKDDIKQIDAEDKWWKDIVRPYKEANEEEHVADKDLAEKWRIGAANISIIAQETSYLQVMHDQDTDDDDDDNDDNDDDDDDDYDDDYDDYDDSDHDLNGDDIESKKVLKHSLYVEYEDDKSAKITPMRTYVDFTFKCRYKIHLCTNNMEEEIRNNMKECELIRYFMTKCQSMSDDLRRMSQNGNDIQYKYGYRHFKTRIHILNIIASFAVTPDKDYRDCVACYFNVCDGIKHKKLRGNVLTLYRNCCDGDFEKERKHDFDTRKCDQLHGIVIDKILTKQNRSNTNNPRYKVLINKRKTSVETYLKFLLIGSNKFNFIYREQRDFNDILVTYPCNTHQFIQIQEKLDLLYENTEHRQNRITRIIFGHHDIKTMEPIKPQFMRDDIYNINPNEYEYRHQHIEKKQIFELFRRLNDSQIDAIYGGLNYNLHTIQGPPATGKTNTCAHIAYLWWMLNQNNKNKKIKIHGMTPTNQGTLLLAQKCHEMNDIMEESPTLRANTICDGFIRRFYNLSIVPTSIRDLLLEFFYDERKDQSKPKNKFKVLYFASKTYANILDIKVLSQKNNDKIIRNTLYSDDGMTMIEKICVNLAANHKLKGLAEYERMSERHREEWKSRYIIDELENADMICTTFGNSTNKQFRELFEKEFTHSIADECNQSSLDTFLGIIGYPNLKYLCMAGDIKQLSPVTMCTNKLSKISVYQHIIKYLTSSTFKPNEYYSRLNKQYRSHPQIYAITTNIFYHGTVDINNNMKYIRAYKQEKKNYCKLFANHANHIQFHILTNNQKQLDTSSQKHSKYNVGEALIAVKYLKKFIIELHYKEEDIAVISDYTAQIDCVYDNLTRYKLINEDKILLCTTNEIEGSSKPIVIYMCCRSNNTGNIGFLNDITRINVATSRAEYGQIIIGDIYTLQYNPIYKQIFDFHQKHKAVVYEDDNIYDISPKIEIIKKNKKNKKNKRNNNRNNNKKGNKKKNRFNLKTIDAEIPLVDISMQHIMDQRLMAEKQKQKHADYYICSGCNSVIFAKLFCGRIISVPPIFIYFCYQCINNYLSKYCKKKIIHSKFNEISAMTIINKSDLNCSDSFGIKLEFDLVLSQYLIKNGLTKFSSKTKIGGNYGLYQKFVKIVWEICYNNKNLKKQNIKYIPQCFRKLAEDYKSLKTLNEDEFCKIVRSDQLRNKAIGIMECKRNHLLLQQIMDSRFFRLVYEIKNCKPELIAFYKNNKYNFYEYREFEQNQPTLIVIAYLKACGYSTNLANYLHKRVGKLLYDKNVNKPSRNSQAIQLNDDELDDLAQHLKLNELIGLNNILSSNTNDSILYGWYAIKLMQNAIIDDPMSKYYEMRKYETAIAKESTFGDDLKNAGFDYYSEKELQDLGYKETPDYLLKKPWIIFYNDIRYEITWIDFKYYYCSSTEWIINKLRFQALRYNKTYGPGAFVFSLGFVKIPNQLKLNCHGLLAAVPLSKQTMSKFINIQKRNKSNKSNK